MFEIGYSKALAEFAVDGVAVGEGCGEAVDVGHGRLTYVFDWKVRGGRRVWRPMPMMVATVTRTVTETTATEGINGHVGNPEGGHASMLCAVSTSPVAITA